MSGADLLGEFERLVLLAILQEGRDAVAIRLRSRLEEGTRRSISRGALYRTLDRLEEKGLVSAQGRAGSEARGGIPRKAFSVTDEGVERLRRSQAVVARFTRGLETLLEERA